MDLVLLLLRLLIGFALYLFLGMIMLLLWRDLRHPGTVEGAAPRRYGRLVVVGLDVEQQDQEEPLELGASFPLQPLTSLGRSPVNTVTIPDAYASAEHAFLVYRGGQWWLEDRGSRNGTTLNDILVNSPTIVSTGDIVGIGQVQLKLELTDPGLGTPSPEFWESDTSA